MRDESKDVLSALRDRQSIRAYKPDPVSREVIEQILDAARFSPSGTNTQPWNVFVLSESVKNAVCEAVLRTREREPEREAHGNIKGEYQYYPTPITEPYLSRRRKVGWEMYAALGVQKGDREASWKVAGRNYQFFGAPVGMIFTLERNLEKGSWIDLGIFLQSVMLAARHFGLDTCAQGAWARYHDVIRETVGIGDDHVIVCGMALGYADRDSPANTPRASRDPLSHFVHFVDDGIKNPTNPEHS